MGFPTEGQHRAVLSHTGLSRIARGLAINFPIARRKDVASILPTSGMIHRPEGQATPLAYASASKVVVLRLDPSAAAAAAEVVHLGAVVSACPWALQAVKLVSAGARRPEDSSAEQ